MNTFVDVFNGIAQKAAKLSPEEPGDYRENGLLYCGKCHTQKQCRVNLMGHEDIVSCLCKCASERLEAEDREIKKREELARISNLRVQGIQDKQTREFTFDKADDSENIRKCRKYVERWPDMLEHNNGLLFWGGVGTGKTFAASCIANALIDRGVPALVTSFPRILNAGWDKTEIIDQMRRFPMMVIDDLGAERQSEYALETVFSVVDERYKAGRPLIVTTNLRLDDLRDPENAKGIDPKFAMDYKRIYDRILEMCVPVAFKGGSRRKQASEDKMRFARGVFG